MSHPGPFLDSKEEFGRGSSLCGCLGMVSSITGGMWVQGVMLLPLGGKPRWRGSELSRGSLLGHPLLVSPERSSWRGRRAWRRAQEWLEKERTHREMPVGNPSGDKETERVWLSPGLGMGPGCSGSLLPRPEAAVASSGTSSGTELPRGLLVAWKLCLDLEIPKLQVAGDGEIFFQKDLL